MTVTDLIQTFFIGGAESLAHAAGLDLQTTRRILGTGLPLQLDALAEQAGTPAEAHVAEAIDSLPHFSSVQDALAGPDGVQNLQHAGELLAPALLGQRHEQLVEQTAGRADTSAAQAQTVLNLTLPLLLSQLGRHGLTGSDVGLRLGGLGGSLAGLTALLGGQEATPVVPSPTPDVQVAAGVPVGEPVVVAAGSPEVPLLELLKAQFSGASGSRIGAAAGFTPAVSARAAQAALPIVLSALIHRGRTDSGATDLLNSSRTFQELMGAEGRLKTDVLTDPAEVARIEGQGRGLMTGLFSNLDAVSGRLGTALGGSGASAGRLLALITPLVLGVLGARAHATGLNGAGFSGLLGGLGQGLVGLLPAGLSSLSGLLTAETTGSPASVTAPVPAPAQVTRVVASPSPAVRTVTPSSPPPTAPVPPARRGGFPWWLIPLLLLLLLGGCWVVNRPKTAAPATVTTPAASVVVTSPAADATLPPAPFTMTGTGPAGVDLSVKDGDQEVGKATVGSDGNWTADLAAPTEGPHTYTVSGGDARSEVKVTVAQDGAAGTSTDTATGTATGTDAAAGSGAPSDAFTLSAPADGAKLSAGGFTLKGAGKAGQVGQLFEDGTSLGRLTVGPDGLWSFAVPSPTAGQHTYTVKAEDGSALGSVGVTIAAPAAGASAAACTKAYTLSMANGQTVNEPFRFGGVGKGKGYAVTVKRGARVIGTKNVPLDVTCGWSYQSRPGPGAITYEVRPLGDAASKPLSTVNLSVSK